MTDTNDAFWDWSVKTYRRPGLSDKLLHLQDAFAFDVNMILWACWTGASGRVAASESALRKAIDLSQIWSRDVVTPLRSARRALKTPPAQADAVVVAALRDRVKKDELAAEHIQQTMLQSLAADLQYQENADPPALARRNLAAYGAYLGAARKEGFSTGLLHEVIDIVFAKETEH